MKHLKALAEIVVCLVVAAAICIATVAICHAIGTQPEEKDDVERCLEEIVPQYEWEEYAYTFQKAIMTEPEKDSRYYLIVVYAPHSGSLHRLEFLCSVRPDDVDCDLLRDDVCEGY